MARIVNIEKKACENQYTSKYVRSRFKPSLAPVKYVGPSYVLVLFKTPLSCFTTVPARLTLRHTRSESLLPKYEFRARRGRLGSFRVNLPWFGVLECFKFSLNASLACLARTHALSWPSTHL